MMFHYSYYIKHHTINDTTCLMSQVNNDILFNIILPNICILICKLSGIYSTQQCATPGCLFNVHSNVPPQSDYSMYTAMCLTRVSIQCTQQCATPGCLFNVHSNVPHQRVYSMYTAMCHTSVYLMYTAMCHTRVSIQCTQQCSTPVSIQCTQQCATPGCLFNVHSNVPHQGVYSMSTAMCHTRVSIQCTQQCATPGCLFNIHSNVPHQGVYSMYTAMHPTLTLHMLLDRPIYSTLICNILSQGCITIYIQYSFANTLPSHPNWVVLTIWLLKVDGHLK